MTPEQIERLKGDLVIYEAAKLKVATFDVSVLRALLAEWEERGRMLDSLKTEPGKAAFALANGWPLPEEAAALRAEIERLSSDLEVADSLILELRANLAQAEARLAKVVEWANTAYAWGYTAPGDPGVYSRAYADAQKWVRDILAAAKG